MSNIYIQEPPTNGKVLLKTSAGEIEIELWSKEAPKTCRNFIQLILDRFYDKTPFHRLVPNFIVQCGLNSEKADLVEPIKNEFHSRLRFMRRGLVGMATNEGSDNNMEFFFTLNSTPELQNVNTIFGKVTGETIYNLLKLGESEIDANERPLHPHKINKIKILHNPFDDLKPRAEYAASKSSTNDVKKQKKEGVKNFKLISFGDEAEQDETEVDDYSRDQPKTSQNIEEDSLAKRGGEDKAKKTLDKKRKKSPSPEPKSPPNKLAEKVQDDDDDSESDYELSLEKEKLSQVESKKREIQEQIQSLKKEYQKGKREKPKDDESASSSKKSLDPSVRDYLAEKEKYKSSRINVKGASREDFTLKLLDKFKAKLNTSKSVSTEHHQQPSEDDTDDSWLSHKLDFSESQIAILAKDASKKEDNWYDIYDPRNPLNKRKRGGDEQSSKSSNKRR